MPPEQKEYLVMVIVAATSATTMQIPYLRRCFGVFGVFGCGKAVSDFRELSEQIWRLFGPIRPTNPNPWLQDSARTRTSETGGCELGKSASLPSQSSVTALIPQHVGQ